MAMWGFGNLLSSGFSDEEQAGFEELTPDAGVPFRREVFTDIQNIVSGSLVLTNNDYIRFKSFYRSETRQGTLTFDFYDCRFGVTRTARFVGKPTYTATSNQWTVNLVLSLDPVVIKRESTIVTHNGDAIVTHDGKRILARQRFDV